MAARGLVIGPVYMLSAWVLVLLEGERGVIFHPVTSSFQALVWKIIEIGQFVKIKYKVNGKEQMPTISAAETSGLTFRLSATNPYIAMNMMVTNIIPLDIANRGYLSFSNCPWLFTKILSLFNTRGCLLYIKDGTNKAVANNIKASIMGTDVHANDDPATIPAQNIRFQKLSLVASFLIMVLSRFYESTRLIVSLLHAISKAFLVRFAIFSCGIS
jgi:hypothetical protein